MRVICFLLAALAVAPLAAQTDPETIQRLYRQHVWDGRPGDAEAVLKSGIEANPSSFHLLSLLAGHYSDAKDKTKLSEVLARMTKGAAKWPEAWLVVGDYRLKLGEFDAAIATYRRGLGGDPGRNLQLQNRITDAQIRRVRGEEPVDMNRGILKDHPRDQDDRDMEALPPDRKEVVHGTSEKAVKHYYAGRGYAMSGNQERAREEFGLALELSPGFTKARLALAQSLVAAKDYNGAIVEAREVLRLEPRNGSARLIESAALLGKNDRAGARALLQRMLEETPGSADAHFQLGVLELGELHYREAEAAFRRAHEMNPKDSRGLKGIVESYIAQGRPDDALRLLDGEIRKAPKSADLRITAGNTAVRAGKYAEGLDYLNQALALHNPKSKEAGEIYLRMGETWRRSGDNPSAIQWLEKARAIMPGNAKVLSTLALSLDTAGRKKESRTAYEEVIKLEPNNGIALNNLAYSLSQTGGDLDIALAYAQRARELLPKHNEIADTLAEIYLKKGQIDEALSIFREIAAKAPGNATFRHHLGAALNRKGRTAEAVKELQAALAAHPTPAEEKEIRALLSRIQ